MTLDLNDIELHIGKQIKMMRMSHKISQKALAKQMGITYQQVQKYENGLNRISVSRLWQVCNIFGVTPDVFYENILTGDSQRTKVSALIPNKMATSQDIKMMLAFKKIEESSKRALIIKLCRAMTNDDEA